MPISTLKEFFRLEAAGGIFLVFAAGVALLIANSSLGGFYHALLELPGSIQIGSLGISKTVLHWVNDLWMAIFFFLVGLEIKREITVGQLASRAELALPVAAAIGGMVLPALIYAGLNWTSPDTLGGWAIPTATDIAFALGVLALLGSRVPTSLTVLLTAVAIIDDLGAIIVIAVFYTDHLSGGALALAAGAVLGLVLLNRLKVTHVAPYIIVGALLWVFVLKSGVHATLAGVITALAIPRDVSDEDGHPIADRLEHLLHPWVAFLILPAFAFANAGISLAGVTWTSLADPVTLGVGAGLVIGKQLGVFLPLAAAIGLGIARMPERATWAHLYGLSVLCGIGFTMSLFIGGLAFEAPGTDTPVRLGVLGGSLISAIAGFLILRFAPAAKR